MVWFEQDFLRGTVNVFGSSALIVIIVVSSFS
jgi:hypothetical protein